MKLLYVLFAVLTSVVLLALTPQGAIPLGELGYEIADSVDVELKRLVQYESKIQPLEIKDRRRFTMLRTMSTDTIYGSSWFSLTKGYPVSYVFWTQNDTISFYGHEASNPFFGNLMPDEVTAIKNTKIALSGAEYNPEELGYFITYVIILKDGKFTIKSGRGNEKPDYSTVTNY